MGVKYLKSLAVNSADMADPFGVQASSEACATLIDARLDYEISDSQSARKQPDYEMRETKASAKTGSVQVQTSFSRDYDRNNPYEDYGDFESEEKSDENDKDWEEEE